MPISHIGVVLPKDPDTGVPAVVAQQSKEANGVSGTDKCTLS